MTEIKKVGVLGAVLMGHGIAQVAAAPGYEVVLRAYEEEAGSAAEIDEAMQLGAEHTTGPLLLADFAGPDLLHSIGDVLSDEFRERRFPAPPTLRKMALDGWYGRRPGMGFYDDSGDVPAPDRAL